jgi:hydroxymethylpyrimidine pyrophosphatase-like HAD family hydrolase
MSTHKVVFTDIDGTLIDRENEIHKFVLELN